MESIEKNDVDISKLFEWKKKLSLKNSKGDTIVTLYIRLAGDADINRARVFALRKSAELRENLRKEVSEERFAYILPYDEESREIYIEAILATQIKTFYKQVSEEIDLPLPTEPSEKADLEAHEKYQKVVDDWSKKRAEILKEKTTKFIEKEKKTLGEIDLEILYKKYEKAVIDTICEATMLDAFRSMTVFLSVYRDNKYITHYFGNYEQFDNLPQDIKKQIFSAYSDLEISTETLKK